ncbi:MAG: ABC transporter ATP-binding protein [Bacillota bacterium]
MYDIDTDQRQYTYSDKTILKRLASYAKPFYKWFALILILVILSVGFALVEPYVIGLSVDILSADTIDVDRLILVLSIFVVSILLAGLFEYMQTMILQKTGQQIVYNMREEIFTHVERQDIEYFNKVPTGKLVTRVANDTNRLNEMYTNVVANVLRNLFMIFGIMGALLYLNLRLALLVLTIMPFVVIFSFVFRRFSRKAYRVVRTNMSRMNGFLAEHLSGMKVVQIFNKEPEKKQEFDEQNDELKRSELKELLVFAIYRPTMYMLFMLATIIIFFYGGHQVVAGTLTVGTLVAFYNYLRRFFQPIQQLAEQFNIVQGAFASSERIFAILDDYPEVLDDPEAIELDEVKGEIEFKNVWFQYVEDEWVLKDVSFHVNPKEAVAFVGATGAGKTTILSLITRDYDIQHGQIFLDGIDITKIKIRSLRAFVGQMLQDVFMFSGTIKSNITLRDPDITMDEVKQACRYVGADKFIEQLPNQYEEPVLERGNNFSAGQRQLISFARTLVHKPSVMILDEATANIDTETEELIQASLKKMMNIGTMLIVAHRLSTIQDVDKIIVLDHGEILEQGSHQELLKQKGHYFYLYKLQYKDQ